MLRDDLHPQLRVRLDRALLRLTHWQAESVRLVGTEALPGVTRRRAGGERAPAGDAPPVPVLPSDHFGLLLTLRRRPAASE